MHTIKFSHPFKKLFNSENKVITFATLLSVSSVEISNIPKQFLAYVTDHGKYKLPEKGSFIILTFLKPAEDNTEATNLFTTIRNYTPEKHLYYYDLIGTSLKIEIV